MGAPWEGAGLDSGAPCGTLMRYRTLCRRQRVLSGLHLPPFSLPVGPEAAQGLQLGPVSFGNLSLKRSSHPASPEILKDK